MIGTLVGNYRVVEKLGDGGMGTVYRALDQMLDREVALKVMKPELSRQAALGERFRLEAIALARLNHPRIAAVYGLERSGDDLAMVMEFVRGETLEAVVQRSGRLAWARALELCAAVCEALDHAHDKGVVHRDIKPANIMLSRDGAVKVMDFGIARIMGKSRQTRVGAAVGTPMYMSPEQLKGEEVDGRSDLYSLGAVCYELITGRLAFEADSDYELMMKQLNEPPPPVRAAMGDVPAVVDAILQRAMAKRREDRYASASAMRQALLHAATAQATTPRRAPADTRLADTPRSPTPPDREVQLPGVGATADHPVAAPAALADTRLAPSQLPGPAHTPGPTRLADGARSVHPASPVADWRLWVGVAALALVGAIGARTMRRPIEPLSIGASAVVPGTQSGAVPQGQRATTDLSVTSPPSSQPAAPPPPSPRSVSGDVARPVDGPGSTPTARDAQRTRQGLPEAARGPRVVADDDQPKPAASPAPPPVDRAEPRPVPAEPAPRSTDEDALGAINRALGAFAEAVSDGSTGRVGSILRADGETEKAWLDLMKEGRLQMGMRGEPQVDVGGSSATARFSATLNVRSAFGANKRRTASFVADLSRSGGTWRVTAVRPEGKVELR